MTALGVTGMLGYPVYVIAYCLRQHCYTAVMWFYSWCALLLQYCAFVTTVLDYLCWVDYL
jgi:hypothetical protein